MVKRPNWIKIRQALQENFLAPDFNDYSTTTFSKVSYLPRKPQQVYPRD